MLRLLRSFKTQSIYLLIIFALLTLHFLQIKPVLSAGPCETPANSIVAENCLPGNPKSEWDISGSGDATIQGFADEISVNKGETVNFKIKTNSSNYSIDIYRIGYYGGSGARKITTLVPSASLPQVQPSCITDSATGLYDCGNWSTSASWPVPSSSTSGIYFAKLSRLDGSLGSSHVIFIVRDDTGSSDLLFQTSDTTWQAYNFYGGRSLYNNPNQNDRAHKVSYNRPFTTRDPNYSHSWVFNAEYPMVKWLERNGYDVSYLTGIDSDRRGSELLEHRIFLSVGHDEYWSGNQRANVEAARAAGINLAFFSGNEVFVKTRWENSVDGTNTPYKTLVSYKETASAVRLDPTLIWTGNWRDPRFSPPADGGRPENALTGTLFMVNHPRTDSIQVPQQYSALRFWRNTSVANLTSGQTAVLSLGTLGHEWNEDLDNGFRPEGLIKMSKATYDVPQKLQNYGISYGPGTATHNLTLYKHNSGSLVFSAGTIQWSWGLEAEHDGGTSSPDVNMQQATVNLFADMAVQPANLQSGLTAAVKSTDFASPLTQITSPPANSDVTSGQNVVISGTASDSGGVVGGVEISTDAGTTWHPANGTTNWNYNWTPSGLGTATIKVRAVDDSANLQASPVSITVNKIERVCPCSIWPATTPQTVSNSDNSALELGVKFRSDVDGFITGVRFYKDSANGGVHSGSLWSSTGQLLATANFTNESASGWQQLNFSNPIAIPANTDYTASYHTNVGNYSVYRPYFTTTYDSPPLHAIKGVYVYGPTAFPTDSYQDSNYWVDVVFNQNGGPPPSPTPTATPAPTPTPLPSPSPSPSSLISIFTTQTPASPVITDPSPVELGVKFKSSVNGLVHGIKFYKDSINTGIHTGKLWTNTGQMLASATFVNESGSGWQQVIFSSPIAITANTTYIASYHTPGKFIATRPYFTSSITNGPLTAPDSTSSSGNGVFNYGGGGFPNMTYQASNYWVDVLFSSPSAPPAPSPTPSSPPTPTPTPLSTSLFTNQTPPTQGVTDPYPIELGLKFKSATAGKISGIRFYKTVGNAGTHIGRLWTTTGTKLVEAAFVGETASGWQQVNFPTPVSITANTVYIASYHAPQGKFVVSRPFFDSDFVNGQLTAPSSSSMGGNGVFNYGGGGFPNMTYQASNYWVDVVFTP